jgi:P pilus assembly chaperone PapD
MGKNGKQLKYMEGNNKACMIENKTQYYVTAQTWFDSRTAYHTKENK